MSLVVSESPLLPPVDLSWCTIRGDRFQAPTDADSPFAPGCAETNAATEARIRDSVNADDLSNELDAEVCEVLMSLLARQDFERAGRVLAAVREAYTQRLLALEFGGPRNPAHESATAAKFAAMGVA